MTKENVIDRDALQQAYIDEILEGMDTKTLMRIVADSLDNNFDSYTVDELIAEVEETYPHLLNDSDDLWYSPRLVRAASGPKHDHKLPNYTH